MKQPNPGSRSGSSAAAKRLAEEKANKKMGRMDMRSSTGMGMTAGAQSLREMSKDSADYYARLGGFKRSRRQNTQVTSRNYEPNNPMSQSVEKGKGASFRRDVKWETAPMEEYGGVINPKVKGMRNISDEYGTGFEPEPKQKYKRRIGNN
jgi:hypothetical protein